MLSKTGAVIMSLLTQLIKVLCHSCDVRNYSGQEAQLSPVGIHGMTITTPRVTEYTLWRRRPYSLRSFLRLSRPVSRKTSEDATRSNRHWRCGGPQ